MAAAAPAVLLRPLTGDVVGFSHAAARLSATLAAMLDGADCDRGSEIPVPHSADALARVAKYCEYHATTAETDDARAVWDSTFMKIDAWASVALLNAANYLAVTPLVRLVCGTIAAMLAGKNETAIFATFGLPHDLTPEEIEIARDSIEHDLNIPRDPDALRVPDTLRAT